MPNPMTSDTPSVTEPAYRVETPRLLLRCWNPADAPVLRKALDHSNEHLRPWIPFMKDEPRSLAQTAGWLREIRASFDQGEHFRYGVFEKDGGELVGENMLLARVGPGALEIGYLTYLGYEGRGYASEATCAMVRTAFEVQHVERVEIHCAPENAASAAIPRRLGFIHEATLRNRAPDTEGRVHDLMIWSLMVTDYPGTVAMETPIAAYNCLGEPVLQS